MPLLGVLSRVYWLAAAMGVIATVALYTMWEPFLGADLPELPTPARALLATGPRIPEPSPAPLPRKVTQRLDTRRPSRGTGAQMAEPSPTSVLIGTIRLPEIRFDWAGETTVHPSVHLARSIVSVQAFGTVPLPAFRQPRGPLSPKALFPLYVTYGILQIADVHSTLRGLHAGGREANPVLASIAHRPTLLVPVKAAAFLGTVYMVQRLKEEHPVAAVALMIGLNNAYIAIVTNNYRVD